LRPYTPLVRNPHLITIASNFWKRDLDTVRFPVQAVKYQVESDVAVRVLVQQPSGTPLGDLVLVHGLEGSADGGYMRSMAQAALERGFAVHRVNLRSCGGTEDWCKTFYHAGLTSDLRYVLQQIGRPVFLCGFSLGGNVVLKLAGELGAAGSQMLQAVCSVSTPIDLAACVRRMEEPDNFIYHRRFLSSMKQRMRRRRIFEHLRYEDIRSIYEIDDRITAPSFGFGTADHYYKTQSSIGFLPDIRVRTLLLTSKDDPLVPFAVYGSPAIGANSHLELAATEHGGHVSFLSRVPPRFWLDAAVLDWFESVRNKKESSLVY
jgi:predicted alpha/beta-fold hydrolase